MNWTSVAKPTGTTYTTVAFQGKEYYDDPSVTYDDVFVYYDTVSINQWTNVPKPKAAGVTVPGMATGLLMPPTYAQREINSDEWTYVPKPS